jgi:hypothetical protein
MGKLRTKLFVLLLASAFAVSGAFATGTAFADDTSEAKAACEALKDAAQDGTEEEREPGEQAKEDCEAALVEPAEEPEVEEPEVEEPEVEEPEIEPEEEPDTY